MGTYRTQLLFAILLAGAMLPGGGGGAFGQDVSPVEISIEKGVGFLYAAQTDGNWELTPQRDPAGAGHDVTGWQWGGLTAMATWALLSAGESPVDPRIEAAVDFLLKADIVGTYALSFRAQVWALLPENHPKRKEIRAQAHRDRDLLLRGMYADKSAPSFGFYSYAFDTAARRQAPAGHYDRSNAQYAALGLRACEHVGVEVPRVYWHVTSEAWRRAQNEDGGWEYTGEGPSSPTMSAAGLATLLLTREYLFDTAAPCKGNLVDKHIDNAGPAFKRNFPELLSDRSLYGLNLIQRVATAAGVRFFGDVNWYAVGSEKLVRTQRANGSWGIADDAKNARSIPDTAFALHFLSRGSAPVVMSKLRWKSVTRARADTGWNQRDQDVQNFSRWMAGQVGRPFLNWQVVNTDDVGKALLDSPVLYMAGSETIKLSDEDVEHLKRFVEEGGLIVGNADCGRAVFAKSFAELGKRIYLGGSFRDLPAAHPLFTNQQFSAERWPQKPGVQGLSNGVRELMILIPQSDPSRAWQVRAEKKIPAMFQLGANLILYANGGRTIQPRAVAPEDGPLPEPARRISVARLEYEGNHDPEPAGWRRLGGIMARRHRVDLPVETVKLGEGKLEAFDVAHLTGTAHFRLDKAQQQELRSFVDGGGTLLIDAAGGAAEFADSAEAELVAIFGDNARTAFLTPLPPDHPVYRSPIPIDQFSYRPFTRQHLTGRSKHPRLRGIEVEGRMAVFFSREDLSAALAAAPTDGIIGYEPETAIAIVRNVLLSSVSRAQ